MDVRSKRFGVENNSSWLDIIKQMVNLFFELGSLDNNDILLFLKKLENSFIFCS